MDPISYFLMEGSSKTTVPYGKYMVKLTIERCQEGFEDAAASKVSALAKQWPSVVTHLLKEYKEYETQMAKGVFSGHRKIMSIGDFEKHLIPIEAFVYCQNEDVTTVTIIVGDASIEKQFGHLFEIPFNRRGVMEKEDIIGVW